METNTILQTQVNQESQLYIPPNCKPLSDETEQQQIRLGLQGQFGEGKTWAALTFPNPIVLNLNRGLGAHVGRKDVHEVKMYDPTFIDSLIRRVPSVPQNPPNKRDAITKWLRDEGHKLTKNQTLIVDSLSDLERAFDMQQRLEPVITSKGQVDALAFWRLKMDWFSETVDTLMSLRCHVVMCAHEQVDNNESGGKLKPLVAGQTANKLGKDFTDWFRQRASDKPKEGDKVKAETLKLFGMTEPEWCEWIKSFPRNTLYYWQTESDNIFSGKCSSLVNFPRFIPANYSSFLKYRRPLSLTS